MKRRGFLGLLGLAPAAVALAKMVPPQAAPAVIQPVERDYVLTGEKVSLGKVPPFKAGGVDLDDVFNSISFKKG